MEGITGFCIKTRDTMSGRKLFINITHNPTVEKPRILPPAEELSRIILTKEGDDFTIPMFVGPLYYTRDKSGDESALVVDSVINTDLFNKFVTKDEFYYQVTVHAALETVEAKFEKHSRFPLVQGWKLDKDKWTKLLNKKRQTQLKLAAIPKPPSQRKPPKHIAEELDRLCWSDKSLEKIGIKLHDDEDLEFTIEPSNGSLRPLKAEREELLKQVKSIRLDKKPETKIKEEAKPATPPAVSEHSSPEDMAMAWMAESCQNVSPDQVDPSIKLMLNPKDNLLRICKMLDNVSPGEKVSVQLNAESIVFTIGQVTYPYYIPLELDYESQEIASIVNPVEKSITLSVPLKGPAN